MALELDSLLAPGMEPRSAVPDRRVSLTLMLVVTLAACAAFAAALAVEVLPSRGMAVVFFAVAPAFAVVALVVLVAQARADHDHSLGWASAGLAVGVVAMLLQLVSFPAVTDGGGPLRTSAQASASLYLLFHVAFVVGATAGALRVPARLQVPSVLVGSALALTVATDSIPLPVLLRGGTTFSPLLIWLEIALVAITGCALALWVRRVGGRAPAPQGWIAVALSLSLYDVLLNALGSERFTALWWASLSFRVATYLVLSMGVLTAVLTRWRDIASYTDRELERREMQLRSSLDVTARLLSSAEDLSRTTEAGQVGDVLSARARAAADAQHAVVLLSTAGEPLRLLGADGVTPAWHERSARIDWDLQLPVPQVASLGTSVFLEDPRQVRTRLPGMSEVPPAGASSLAALPITVRGHPVGVLAVWSPTPRSWSTDQRRLLAAMAIQGGQAIARAQAYEQAATAARTLQESLLPSRLPTPARLEIAARYVPSGDTQGVGGDWYDCLIVTDHQVALVVGDVMGKGLRAAAQMGQIRMAVRSLATLDPSPAAVLTALDDLNLELTDDEIVTLVYILLDTEAGTAQIARAGHLPPLLVGPDATATFIEAGASTPLGIPDGDRVEATFSILPGSLLVLYTDGLVEDPVTGLGPGMVSLSTCLSDHTAHRAPISDLAERVLAVSRDHQGQDDIALLVTRYT